MRVALLAVTAVVGLASLVRAGDCPTTAETLRVRVEVELPVGIKVAGVVVALSYPTDKLAIPGSGIDAGRAAVSGTPPGASTASEDRDGELRQVVAQATPLAGGPLFAVTFRRCEKAPPAMASELTCRVLDASDDKTNVVDGAQCRVEVSS